MAEGGMFRGLLEHLTLSLREGVEEEFSAIQEREELSREEVEKLCRDTSGPYWKWVLAKWAKEVIRLPEDQTRVRDALKSFDKNKSKLQQKDINQYKTVTEIEDAVGGFVDSGEKKVSKKVHSWAGMPGVEVVQQKGPYTTVKVTDVNSLQKLGEGTKWCTRGSYKPSQAERYLKMYKHIFIVFESGHPVMQYTPDYSQIMDINDDTVKDKALRKLIPPPEEITPESAYNYAHMVIYGRFPEGENAIAEHSDPLMVEEYVRYGVKGPFPKGEATISRDSTATDYYLSYLQSIGQTPAHPELFK
jgi:hypothetical protein